MNGEMNESDSEISHWGGVVATALDIANAAALLAVVGSREDAVMAQHQVERLIIQIGAISRFIVRHQHPGLAL